MIDTPFALYCLLRHEIDNIVHAAHGSVFDTITAATFELSRVILPPAAVLAAFERAVSSLFCRCLANIEEARILSALRDTLLPKLISSELRIKSAEKLVARYD